MGVYFQRDLKQYDDGDLDLSSGDLEIATVQRSQRQLLVTILNTTRGDMGGDTLVGWGGDNYMGRPNSETTHSVMDKDLGMAFRMIQDLIVEDLDWKVSRLDTEQALIVVAHRGTFIEKDGTTNLTPMVLGWQYPFQTGKIELADEVEELH